MIKEKEIATLKVPFPNISSGLAVKSHMYICKVSGKSKEMLKCGSFKPKHAIKGFEPIHRVVKDAGDGNTFNVKTVIDCDRIFIFNDIKIDKSIVKGHISNDVMKEIHIELNNNSNLKKELISKVEMKSLNIKITDY